MRGLGGWVTACAVLAAGCDEAFTSGGVTTATPLRATITARGFIESLRGALNNARP